jgi:serine/threonine-protein kinase RsbW
MNAMCQQPNSRWVCHHYRSTREVPDLLGLLEAEMIANGFGDRDLFAVKLALEEALVNAIKHGHNYDESKTACFRYEVMNDRVVMEVEDEGPGFNPDGVPDPLAEENWERSSGRGLFLMRTYLTSVDYNERGNQVTLCKHRS